MVRTICAFALSILSGPIPGAAYQEGSPRSLYQDAARQVAKKDYAAAIRSLKQLVSDFPESSAAKQGRYHLAECLLAADQPLESLTTILSTTKEELASAENSLELVSRLPSKSKTLARSAIQAAVFKFEQEERFEDAIHLQSFAGTLFDDAAHRKKNVRLAIRGCLYLRRNEQSCDRLLNALEAEQRYVVRFGLAEALVAAGDLATAERALESLIKDLRIQKQMNRENRVESQHTLLPPAYLRLTSLKTKQKKASEAIRLAQSCSKEFPNFRFAHEFEFLLAQNLIANIQFNAAHQVLSNVVQTHKSHPNHAARAQWLIAELYFLQDNIQLAMEAYKAVENYPSPTWSMRARLQRAKCLELIQEPDKAKSLYESLVTADDDQIVTQASARLALLAPQAQKAK